jgi:Rod binding domain-containing protein
MDSGIRLAAIHDQLEAGSAIPKRAEDAAVQFESILLQQMLRSVREAGQSDRGSASSNMLDFADQHLAQVLAQNGGIGIAAVVARGLGSPRPPVPEVNQTK